MVAKPSYILLVAQVLVHYKSERRSSTTMTVSKLVAATHTGIEFTAVSLTVTCINAITIDGTWYLYSIY